MAEVPIEDDTRENRKKRLHAYIDAVGGNVQIEKVSSTGTDHNNPANRRSFMMACESFILVRAEQVYRSKLDIEMVEYRLKRAREMGVDEDQLVSLDSRAKNLMTFAPSPLPEWAWKEAIDQASTMYYRDAVYEIDKRSMDGGEQREKVRELTRDILGETSRLILKHSAAATALKSKGDPLPPPEA
jgi:hypothetical protein